MGDFIDSKTLTSLFDQIQPLRETEETSSTHSTSNTKKRSEKDISRETSNSSNQPDQPDQPDQPVTKKNKRSKVAKSFRNQSFFSDFKPNRECSTNKLVKPFNVDSSLDEKSLYHFTIPSKMMKVVKKFVSIIPSTVKLIRIDIARSDSHSNGLTGLTGLTGFQIYYYQTPNIIGKMCITTQFMKHIICNFEDLKIHRWYGLTNFKRAFAKYKGKSDLSFQQVDLAVLHLNTEVELNKRSKHKMTTSTHINGENHNEDIQNCVIVPNFHLHVCSSSFATLIDSVDCNDATDAIEMKITPTAMHMISTINFQPFMESQIQINKDDGRKDISLTFDRNDMKLISSHCALCDTIHIAIDTNHKDFPSNWVRFCWVFKADTMYPHSTTEDGESVRHSNASLFVMPWDI